MRTKGEIRRELTARRDAIATAQIDEWSQAIRERLLSSNLITRASVVLAYASKGNEVETLQLIQSLVENDHEVLLPAIAGAVENRVMNWLPIGNIEELGVGMFGILEPPLRVASASPPPPGAPVVIPGVAFTPSGQRLGRGGGYYDRFLADHRGPRIALAFEFQLLPELPKNALDVRMDAIVTERRWIFSER